MNIDPTLVGRGRISVRGGTLRLDRPEGAGEVVTLDTEPVIVGRDPSCRVVLADPHVSALHAELVATDRGVRLRDLGSRNGTLANGLRVTEAYILERTRITLGDVALVVEVAEPSSVAISEAVRFGALFGENPRMRMLFARLAKLAPSELTVLVLGETGTGKELVARAIHEASERKDGPLIVVDCGAVPSSLAESILFGHIRGAFTGASENRTSPFVQANGGTLFLDELGELPLDVQPKLLRALAERRVQAVGAKDYVPFDARIVCATRRDLVSAVNEGEFRSDLYFRVAQAVVEVPPLRDRTDDIPGLVRELLSTLGAAEAWPRVPRDAIARLLRHDWPGNVRELRNAVTVALAFAGDAGQVEVAEHLLNAAGTPAALGYHEAKREALARFERGYFSMLAAESGGNIAEIGRRAGLQPAHVRRYLKAHGLLVPRALRRRR